MKYICFLLVLFVGFSSCKKKDKRPQSVKDEETIKQYIADHNLTAIATGSGLYVVVNNHGGSVSCNANSTVKVAYKGYFTSGDTFDQSPAAGVQFNLQNVIKGWTEGIPYFNKGGDGILLIPSALGYGTQGSGSIPGNSVLIFDVKLVDVL